MDIKIQKLLADLSDYMVASKEEDEAREAYDGHSWGYHGGSLIERRQEAGEAFGKSLEEYIDERALAIANKLLDRYFDEG